MGEAERTIQIMIKFKRKQNTKYTIQITIMIFGIMFMIWRAVN